MEYWSVEKKYWYVNPSLQYSGCPKELNSMYGITLKKLFPPGAAIFAGTKAQPLPRA